MTPRAMVASIRGTAAIAKRGAPLLAIGFLADASFLMVYLVVLQTYLPESLGASAAIAGWALAAYGLAKLITQVAAGVISDRMGTRRALIAGTGLLFVATLAIIPLAHVAPWLIVPVAALDGLGASLTWPAIYSAGAARFGEGEKARFTSMLTLATGVALLAGLGLGARVQAMASFNEAMLVPASCVTIALLIAALTPLHVNEALHLEQVELPSLRRLREILASPARVAFASVILVEACALGGLTVVFRAYGRDVLGVSLTREEILLLPAGLGGALAVVAGGWIADHIGARRVMAPGFFIAGVCILALTRWTDPAFVMVVAGIAGAGFGLAVPTIAATMMSLADGAGRMRGGVIGWFMTADGFGHAAGPAIAGVVLAVFGAHGAHAVLGMGGVMFIIVAAVAATQRFAERPQTFGLDAREALDEAERVTQTTSPAAREPVAISGGRT